jgi:transcriptional antiterminator RfaH
MKERPGMISSALAELSLCVSEPAWFCVRTHLKHEHIAAAHLRLIPDVGVFNPRLRLLRSTRRGPVWSTESVFPNYLFARFVLERKLETVRFTIGVVKVVQFGEVVPSIPDATIQQLQQDLEELGAEVLTDAPEAGEEVEITAGAFRGLKGSVTRVLPAKQRVEILLDFLGRSIATEVSLAALLFRRRDPARILLPVATGVGGTGSARSATARTLSARAT